MNGPTHVVGVIKRGPENGPSKVMLNDGTITEAYLFDHDIPTHPPLIKNGIHSMQFMQPSGGCCWSYGSYINGEWFTTGNNVMPGIFTSYSVNSGYFTGSLDIKMTSLSSGKTIDWKMPEKYQVKNPNHSRSGHCFALKEVLEGKPMKKKEPKLQEKSVLSIADVAEIIDDLKKIMCDNCHYKVMAEKSSCEANLDCVPTPVKKKRQRVDCSFGSCDETCDNLKG